MKFLSKIFKRSKTIDDVFDKDNGHLSKIGAWIGNNNFTDEERAEMMVGVSKAVREFSITTANQSTERSILTRDVAVMWIKTQLALVLVSTISAIFNHKSFDLLWQITTSDVLTWGTFGVMTYFFGAYGYGAHIKGKK